VGKLLPWVEAKVVDVEDPTKVLPVNTPGKYFNWLLNYFAVADIMY